MVRKNWTIEEKKYLLDNYKDLSYSEIGNYLNRSFKSVSTKAKRMKISRVHLRTDKFKKFIKERMLKEIGSPNHRYKLFQKGENHISKNKEISKKRIEGIIRFYKENKGKLNYPQHFKKGDIRISGKNNHNWRGGVRLRMLYPTEYIKLRPTILERDKSSCVICNKNTNLTIHHIDHNRNNNNPINLVTLCRHCNSREMHQIKKWQDFLKVISFNKEVWENPKLIHI